jgi:glutamate racemase
MSSRAAIGFFDSGVGGLSVLRHALIRTDGSPLVYVGDSAHAPYGVRPPEEVIGRCRAIARFLAEQGAEAIVVACNTATAIAVDTLRSEFDLPIIGMEPALKPAARLTRSGKVAVLATQGTLLSRRYARLLSDHGREIEIHERICRHWVEAVEEGDLENPRVFDLVNAELRPLHRAGVDTYVLGCTHFPFLAPVIRRVVGESVNLVDPGPAVVDQLCRRLVLEGSTERPSPVRLFSSGPPDRLAAHAHALIGLAATGAALPA